MGKNMFSFHTICIAFLFLDEKLERSIRMGKNKKKRDSLKQAKQTQDLDHEQRIPKGFHKGNSANPK